MNISIAIVDTDKDYVFRLSEVLQQYKDLSISIFSDVERFYTALNRSHFDILLFDPDASEEKITLSKVKLAICLCSDECRNMGMYTGCVRILKYQRVSDIYKEILREYADKAGYSVNFGSRMNTELIGVYSPCGGAGKTTIALALACRLKSLGNTVLFISTEQLDSSSAVNSRKEEGLAAMIEAINNEKVNFKVKLTALSKCGMDDMEYLEGFVKLVDYQAVTGSEIAGVMEHIKRDSDYQYVVVDMDSNLDSVNQAVFEAADKILLVEKPGELPVHKTELFMRQIFVQDQKYKMFRLHNFAENNSVYSEELEFPVIGKVHNYGNLKLKNMIHAINFNGEYDVDRLLN